MVQVAAPEGGEKVPAVQLAQKVAPWEENVPAGHKVQVELELAPVAFE